MTKIKNATSGVDRGSFMRDIGENYQYVKTLVVNRIEIKKLESLDKLSSIISSVLIGAIVALLVLFLLVILTVALIVFLAQLFDSTIYGLLAVSGGLVILIVISIYIVKPLITKSIKGKMVTSSLNKYQND